MEENDVLPDAIFRDLEHAEAQVAHHHHRRRPGGRIGTRGVAVVAFTALLVLVGAATMTGSSLWQPSITTQIKEDDAASAHLLMVPLLGKSKTSKSKSSKSKSSKSTTTKDTKATAKDTKATAKEAKKLKEEEVKAQKAAEKEALKLKEEEAKKVRAAAVAAKKLQEQEAKAATKAAQDKAKQEQMDAKKAAEEKKEQEVDKALSYPGCLKINVTYVKTLLPWADHEVAAEAQGCHLASVHSLAENSKLATAGLFQLSSGLEIAAHFMSGAVLARDYYLGGYLEDDVGWAWTDKSVWDFGFNDTTTTSTSAATEVGGNSSSFTCLKASVNFTDLGKRNISYVDHWTPSLDCSTPLPAIYKCCLLPDSAPPSSSPTETPTHATTLTPSGEPTEPPTGVPTATPTVTPTDPPTLTPTDLPTLTPTTDAPTLTPTDEPTLSPTDLPTLTPTTNAPTSTPTRTPTTKRPTRFPTTASPTASPPTRSPTALPTTAKPTPLPPSSLEPTIDAVVHHAVGGGTEPKKTHTRTTTTSMAPEK